MTYDPQNIFAKILRGEIPCNKIYEDEYALSFHDINPQAPIHALVIPKGPYQSMTDFTAKASSEEISGTLRAIGKVVDILNLPEDGYRVLSNTGTNGGQEVPHLHFHIFGGKRLGRMLV
ncbi:MAG: histidine triad nucleotide-binding protein [Spirochaetia bacterium]|nr:histidine triad nucleotide-binding protein [Spirochaetia bacterium]